MYFPKVAFAALLAALPAAAGAVIIDFESLAINGFTSFSTYTQAGFTVTGRPNSYMIIGGYNGSPTKHLLGGFYDTTTDGQLTVAGSSPFTFNSIGYSGSASCGTGQAGATCQNLLTFTGYLGATQVYSQNRLLPSYSSADYLTVAGVNAAIDRLVIGSSGFTIQLDNIDVSAAAVPEPASWAMMVVGFGALGATMRRRKRAQVRLA